MQSRTYKVQLPVTATVTVAEGDLAIELDLVTLPWAIENNVTSQLNDGAIKEDADMVRAILMTSPFNHTIRTTYSTEGN